MIDGSFMNKVVWNRYFTRYSFALEGDPDQKECRILYGSLLYTAVSNSPKPWTRPASHSNFKAFLPFLPDDKCWIECK